jgi:hypothetical protein
MNWKEREKISSLNKKRPLEKMSENSHTTQTSLEDNKKRKNPGKLPNPNVSEEEKQGEINYSSIDSSVVVKIEQSEKLVIQKDKKQQLDDKEQQLLLLDL